MIISHFDLDITGLDCISWQPGLVVKEVSFTDQPRKDLYSYTHRVL